MTRTVTRYQMYAAQKVLWPIVHSSSSFGRCFGQDITGLTPSLYSNTVTTIYIMSAESDLASFQTFCPRNSPPPPHICSNLDDTRASIFLWGKNANFRSSEEDCIPVSRTYKLQPYTALEARLESSCWESLLSSRLVRSFAYGKFIYREFR